MFSMLRNERGNWSLIGLLVAVAIGMVVFYVVLMPKLNTTSERAQKEGLVTVKKDQTIYGASLDKAKETECSSNLGQIRTMVTSAKAENESGQPPKSLAEMKGLQSIESCPVTKQPYSYNPTTGEVHCTTPGHEKL